jgi:hypothetical protein
MFYAHPPPNNGSIGDRREDAMPVERCPDLRIRVRVARVCRECCNPDLLPDGYQVHPGSLCLGGARLAGGMVPGIRAEGHLYTPEGRSDTGTGGRTERQTASEEGAR